MKSKYLILLCILMFCSFCQNSSKSIDNEFEYLYDKLPQIELPLSIQTSSTIMFNKDLPDITDTILIQRFGSRDGFERPLGKVLKDSNFFVVLSFIPDDVGTPIISTYSRKGIKIDSLMIFDSKPASIRGSSTKEFATIQKNLQIEFLDSTKNLDTMDRVIEIEVISKTYLIDKKGVIKQK